MKVNPSLLRSLHTLRLQCLSSFSEEIFSEQNPHAHPLWDAVLAAGHAAAPWQPH